MKDNYLIKKTSRLVAGVVILFTGVILLPVFLVSLVKNNFSSHSYDYMVSADGGFETGSGLQGGCQGSEGGPCCNN